MEFHFLLVIGLGVFFGWWTTDTFFLPKDIKPARSWYAVPVVGAVMVFTWVFIQLVQTLS